jgi:hypothetical protein
VQFAVVQKCVSKQVLLSKTVDFDDVSRQERSLHNSKNDFLRIQEKNLCVSVKFALLSMASLGPSLSLAHMPTLYKQNTGYKS